LHSRLNQLSKINVRERCLSIRTEYVVADVQLTETLQWVNINERLIGNLSIGRQCTQYMRTSTTILIYV